MKTNIDSKFALFVIIVFTIGTIYLIVQDGELTKKEIENLNLAQPIMNVKLTKEINQQNVFYQINEGNGKIISSELTILNDSTVFSLLEDLSQKENFKIETKEYKDMGILVESIDGVKNGTNNKYWQYWVNGDLPMVAADKELVKGGDKIEWKFDLANF